MIRLLVEVHVVRGADAAESFPMLMPTISVKIWHIAVTWVAVMVVSHSPSDSVELGVSEVEIGPVSVSGSWLGSVVGSGVSSGSSSPGPGGSSVQS